MIENHLMRLFILNEACRNLTVPRHGSLSNLREPNVTRFTVFTHLTLCFKMIDTRDLGGKYLLLNTTIYIFLETRV